MTTATLILPLILASAVSATATPEQHLACRLDALSAAQRERHGHIAEALSRAVVGVRELPDGYALSLELSRVVDAHGEPYCVVEVAEWVDLEARCCPFLSFAIGVSGRGGAVTLSLTGVANVKAFLKTELPLLEKGVHGMLPE